jgi:hypothetical protein
MYCAAAQCFYRAEWLSCTLSFYRYHVTLAVIPEINVATWIIVSSLCV